jgi:monoamine oxidase
VSQVRGLVIVGGGAAGIGAGIEARARGLDALIVEAGNRLGGRGHSIQWRGYTLDLGCTWLHSAERNSLRVEAERAGATIDRSDTNWFGQYRDLGFPQAEQTEAAAAFEELEERLASNPPLSDRASDSLEKGNPWNAWLNALSNYINGAALDQVSVTDWMAYDNDASSHNWRLPGGYGALIESIGAPLEHRLATPVKAISRSGESVQLTTDKGVIEAEKVIVTVPTATLNRIRFDPPIDGLVEAAEQLPLGLANKVLLSLEDAEDFPHNAHLIGSPRSAETGSYTLRPLGIPIVEGFFGGDGARALETLDDEGAAALALDELVALLGSNFRKRAAPIAVSRWAAEPWIGGSYSHARPGQADARSRLANAGDGRIAFAGEAVSTGDYSTAHGAFDSGKAALARLSGSER